MDRFAEKQARIDRCRAEAFALYPLLWSKMIAKWKTSDPQAQVRLTYSANYLFRTNNAKPDLLNCLVLQLTGRKINSAKLKRGSRDLA